MGYNSGLKGLRKKRRRTNVHVLIFAFSSVRNKKLLGSYQPHGTQNMFNSKLGKT
jgi:hypothetical protein